MIRLPACPGQPDDMGRDILVQAAVCGFASKMPRHSGGAEEARYMIDLSQAAEESNRILVEVVDPNSLKDYHKKHTQYPDAQRKDLLESHHHS